MAVMDVLLMTFTDPAATPPNLTAAPAANPLPLIATAVPPPVGPELGVTPLTVGTDAGGTLPVFGRMVESFISVPGEVLR